MPQVPGSTLTCPSSNQVARRRSRAESPVVGWWAFVRSARWAGARPSDTTGTAHAEIGAEAFQWTGESRDSRRDPPAGPHPVKKHRNNHNSNTKPSWLIKCHMLWDDMLDQVSSAVRNCETRWRYSSRHMSWAKDIISDNYRRWMKLYRPHVCKNQHLLRKWPSFAGK